MKISYNWLQTYFNETLPSVKDVAETLTFHSFEVEGIEERDGDYVLDIDVLPNRAADCFSHRGVAKELSVIFEQQLARDPLQTTPSLTPDAHNLLSVSIDDVGRCSRYSAAVLEGVYVDESPEWLKNRLVAIGQQSINNVVDILNFIMLDMGQPLHAFDWKKLEGDEKKVIHVRDATTHEKLVGLDESEYELSHSDLIITDGANGAPLGVAGIKGGKESGVSAKTNTIILEAAHFNPTAIRRSSRELKLQTDASIRFQNNPSAELTPYALYEAVNLLTEHTGARIRGYVDTYPRTESRKEVTVHAGDINDLLGTQLGDKEVESILGRLQFSYKKDGDTFIVTPSFERRDITSTEDLIEEVGRIHGYKDIESTPLPPLKERIEGENKRFFYSEKVRDALLRLGFSEVYTSTFSTEGDIRLENPFAKDKSALRANLRDGLAESIAKNAYNAPLLGLWESVKLFEVGPVFSRNEKGHEAFAIGIAARALTGKKKTEKENEYIKEAQKAVEEVLNTKLSWTEGGSIVEAHIDSAIAHLGESEERIHGEHMDIQFKPISPYPFVLRDIAVWVPSNVTPNDVLKEITGKATSLLVNTEQFDSFEKEGYISYAFHLVFQSHEKTLTDEGVNEIMETVTTSLNEKEGWSVR